MGSGCAHVLPRRRQDEVLRAWLSHQWAVCSAALEAILPVGSGGAHGSPISRQYVVQRSRLSHQWAVCSVARETIPLVGKEQENFNIALMATCDHIKTTSHSFIPKTQKLNVPSLQEKTRKITNMCGNLSLEL